MPKNRIIIHVEAVLLGIIKSVTINYHFRVVVFIARKWIIKQGLTELSRSCYPSDTEQSCAGC